MLLAFTSFNTTVGTLQAGNQLRLVLFERAFLTRSEQKRDRAMDELNRMIVDLSDEPVVHETCTRSGRLVGSTFSFNRQ